MEKITRGQIIELIALHGRENVVISLGEECTVTLISEGGGQTNYLYEMKKAGELDDVILGELEIAPKIKVVAKKPSRLKTLSAKSIQEAK